MAAAVIAPWIAGEATCTVLTLVPNRKTALSTMQRSESSASEGSFWTTIELLADRGRRRRSATDVDDIVPTLDLPSRRSSAVRCLF